MSAVEQAPPAAGGAAGLERLRSLVLETVAGLVPDGERFAIVDWPLYPNVGDSAMWLGVQRALGLAGRRPAYTASQADFSERELRARIGDGPVLVTGGGNFGDIWVEHQRFRERLLERLPRNPIVQLPQSIWFDERAALERARRLVAAHPHVTLLLRDRRSYELARSEFDADVRLVPDLAFALPPLPRPVEPDVDVLWLARGDREAAAPPLEREGVEIVDWPLYDPPQPAAARARRVARSLRLDRAPIAVRAPLRARAHDAAARRRLDCGLRLLARGRHVVTDRLHGHVLCLLLGVPHVVLDQRYGKVGDCWETWTRGLGDARFATSSEHALLLAKGEHG